MRKCLVNYKIVYKYKIALILGGSLMWWKELVVELDRRGWLRLFYLNKLFKCLEFVF